MTTAVIISDEARSTDAEIIDDRLTLDPAGLLDALGWELKAEGLCRDEICVPVRDTAALFVGDRLDVAAVAAALGRPAVVDADAHLAAVALPAEQRRRALDSLTAPPFTLNDLDGTPHALPEWQGKKKLLLAFSSW